MAPSSRGRNGSAEQVTGRTTQASASAARMPTKMTGSGGVRKRRVASIAASTTTSTPAKTSALTNQVVPNSSANWRRSWSPAAGRRRP